MSAFKVGDRVRVKRNEQGRRLLAGWTDRTETGTVTVVISESHIIVQRDGYRPNGVSWAGYWELIEGRGHGHDTQHGSGGTGAGEPGAGAAEPD